MRSFKNQGNLPPADRPPLSPEKKRLVISIVINSALLAFIYFGANYGFPDPALWFISAIVSVGYWVAFAVFLLIFIIYNRAFTRRNLTVDMLPIEWTREKREEYIASGKRRLERSKWMVSVIIPLLVPIALDYLYIFTLPIFTSMFQIS